MICAFCKNDIEADSLYCDQCGEEIMVCEKCGKPGKGKRCTEDGGKMISAKDKGTQQTQTQQFASPAASFSPNPQQNLGQTQFQAPQQQAPAQNFNSANTQANNQNFGAPQYSGQPTNNFTGQTPAPANNYNSTQRVNTPTIPANNSNTTPGINTSVFQNTASLALINKAINATLQIKDGDIIGRKAGNFVNIFGSFNQISGRHAQFNYNPNSGWILTDLGSSNGTKYMGVPLIPNVPQAIKDKSFIVFANIEFYVQIVEPVTQQANNLDNDRTIRL